jgi:hypothetical protein
MLAGYARKERLRAEILTLSLLRPSLTRLLSAGVSEQDIVDIAELLDNSGDSGCDKNSSNHKNITIQEIRSLIFELCTYGSIQLTIKQMSQKVDKLRSQVASLLTERRDLDAQNQTISSTLAYSKQMVSLLSGTAMSLRSEIAGIVTILAYIMHLLNLEVERQQQQQQKLSYDNTNTDNDEFLPLIKVNRGEDVDLPRLKIAVTKAIDMILTRLNDSKLKKVLSKARLSLLNEQLQI